MQMVKICNPFYNQELNRIMDKVVVRSEYPRMQFRREDAWLNLNGEWAFAFDPGKSGIDRRLFEHPEEFPDRIVVPFAPESRLSGLGRTDFCESVFYTREFSVPAEWKGRRIFMNFGAVDYRATVWIDGVEAGNHFGGSSPFAVDITALVGDGGVHRCTVHALDELRGGTQGGGKQSRLFYSHACDYTRTTGIWQTVWLEAVDRRALSGCTITPDIDGGQVTLVPEFYSLEAGTTLHIRVLESGRVVSETEVAAAPGVPVTLPVPEARLWSTTDPFLYDLELELFCNGERIDRVESYFGMRKIHIEGNRIYLNNRPIFLRLVLDQGFYPEGIWTAPDDESLRRDIELSKAAGFNGARLHQKVFEERFHYWADKLGYLTWGEYPSWGIDYLSFEAKFNFMTEWSSVVCRDRNHPSIIAWTPFNETGGLNNPVSIMRALDIPGPGERRYREFVSSVYDLTRRLDPTRPVNDTSGYTHVKTDIWTVHCYRSSAAELEASLFPAEGGVLIQNETHARGYCGQPYINDEWGGFKYVPAERRASTGEGWGYYGMDLKTPGELIDKIREQAEYMISAPELAGYCYTQLTDIEQEQNGVYTYDRGEKAPAGELRKCFGIKPEWSAE